MENLGELIERKYIQVTDPDKLGLPRVMGHIEVSCKGGLMSRTYVSQLVDMIWKVANEEHQPGLNLSINLHIFGYICFILHTQILLANYINLLVIN